MTAARRPPKPQWAALVITSGLAAIISGVLSLVGASSTQTAERAAQRCQLAAQVLQDETPSPYMDRRIQQGLLIKSAQVLERCLEAR